MRSVTNSTYDINLEKRIVNLGMDFTPENFSTIEVPLGIPLLDYGAISFKWVGGSINGVDVAKIKALVSYVNYFSQEYLEYDLPVSKAAVVNKEGIVNTIPVDGDLPYDIDSSGVNTYVIEIRVPEGWDGRNSFIKMPWEDIGPKAKKGPLTMIQQVANSVEACNVGWTVYKSERTIRLTFVYPEMDNITHPDKKSAVWKTNWNDISVKLWRNKNASRR